MFAGGDVPHDLEERRFETRHADLADQIADLAVDRMAAGAAVFKMIGFHEMQIVGALKSPVARRRPTGAAAVTIAWDSRFFLQMTLYPRLGRRASRRRTRPAQGLHQGFRRPA